MSSHSDHYIVEHARAIGCNIGPLKPQGFQPIRENTVEIEYLDVKLECTYEYDPGERGGWEHEGIAPFAVLMYCKAGGVDVFPLLSEDQVEEIEALICNRTED